MTTFEYSTEALDPGGFVSRDEHDQDALDALLEEKGDDGWELVQPATEPKAEEERPRCAPADLPQPSWLGARLAAPPFRLLVELTFR
jgi:hypothetical protein